MSGHYVTEKESELMRRKVEKAPGNLGFIKKGTKGNEVNGVV